MSSFGRRIRMSTAALVAAVLLVQPPLSAQRPEVDEDGVKAAFLYNFTKFVDWPVLGVRRARLRSSSVPTPTRAFARSSRRFCKANRCAAVPSPWPPQRRGRSTLPPALFLEGCSGTSSADPAARSASPGAVGGRGPAVPGTRRTDCVRARKRSRAVRGQQARGGRRGSDDQLAAAPGGAPVRRDDDAMTGAVPPSADPSQADRDDHDHQCRRAGAGEPRLPRHRLLPDPRAARAGSPGAGRSDRAEQRRRAAVRRRTGRARDPQHPVVEAQHPARVSLRSLPPAARRVPLRRGQRDVPGIAACPRHPLRLRIRAAHQPGARAGRDLRHAAAALGPRGARPARTVPAGGGLAAPGAGARRRGPAVVAPPAHRLGPADCAREHRQRGVAPGGLLAACRQIDRRRGG